MYDCHTWLHGYYIDLLYEYLNINLKIKEFKNNIPNFDSNKINLFFTPIMPISTLYCKKIRINLSNYIPINFNYVLKRNPKQVSIY